MTLTKKSIILKEALTHGMPAAEHFEIQESEAPEHCDGSGKILVQLLAISADPYLRLSIKEGGAIAPGKPMEGFVAGKVLESTHDHWSKGELFGANLPFETIQELVVADVGSIWKLPGLKEDQIGLAVGILGMPGSTAYAGVVDLLRPNGNGKEVIWVSAAAGAVGTLVGQIAKNVYGCTVIGTAGGPEKCKLLKEKFGFDYAIDYKKANGDGKVLEQMIREVAPDGIDMYFESVGGIHFEAAHRLLRDHGRIAVCGGISGYNDLTPPTVTINPMSMIYSAQRIEGFTCFAWLAGERGEFHQTMPKWIAEGKVLSHETEFNGIENWDKAFAALFTGQNTGKVVLRV